MISNSCNRGDDIATNVFSEINFRAKKLGDLDTAKYSIIHPHKIFEEKPGPNQWAFTVFKDPTPKLTYNVQDIAGISL